MITLTDYPQLSATERAISDRLQLNGAFNHALMILPRTGRSDEKHDHPFASLHRPSSQLLSGLPHMHAWVRPLPEGALTFRS
jgi:hypothetical protein